MVWGMLIIPGQPYIGAVGRIDRRSGLTMAVDTYLTGLTRSNAERWRMPVHVAAPLLVIAGAAQGKTNTLVRRVESRASGRQDHADQELFKVRTTTSTREARRANPCEPAAQEL